MVKRVILIHFQPVELFPPVLNMIDFFSTEKNIELIVCTNNKLKENVLKNYENNRVKIYRPASLTRNKWLQYINYFSFYFSSIFLLLWYKPDVVLYIETLSSWPALIYKKIKREKVKLMVHYHEYIEPALYESGMFLARYMHKIERNMYSTFSWISHTNSVRMKMFREDNKLNNVDDTIFNILPNYPSKLWLNSYADKKVIGHIKKMVFVGSLGYENMYLKEVVDFLSHHPAEFSLDVYSYNIDEKAKSTLLNCENKNINFLGGCDYQSLPEILKQYDIGLVIYKPFSKNTIHAVSNKVFEYLACGLDVWYSADMEFTHSFGRTGVYPKIVSVDFNKFNEFDYESAFNRNGLNYFPSTFFYEDVYPKMVSHFLDPK